MIEHRFIVVGAFQTLNAAEARHHFGIDDGRSELVFLVPPQERAADETRTMIAATGWSNVREIGPPNTTITAWARKVRNARSLLAESAGLRHLVIGNYQTQIARHAAHGAGDGDGEVVVLDDGFDTIRIDAYRRAVAAGERPPRLHPQVARHRYEAQRVVARALGLRIGYLPKVTFFTIYDVAGAPGDSVVRNRFDWLRSRFGTPEVVDGTLFLGSPLVESGIVSADTYLELLRRLRDRTDGTLWYRPHPREHPDRVGRLPAEAGVEILELDTVVEYGLMEAGWIPATVAANHSTTLDTLRVLAGDRVSIQSVPLPLHLVARRWREWVGRAYQELDGRLGERVERLELL